MLGRDHVTAHNPPLHSQSKLHAAESEKALSAQSRKEQLTQIARLVADGQIELPRDLPADQFQFVVESVRERRRQNLVRHIARCIAADILHCSERKER